VASTPALSNANDGIAAAVPLTVVAPVMSIVSQNCGGVGRAYPGNHLSSAG